eukprot:TRINITY_DN2547_c0_g1_i1.p1 TRINITY_DN2547_c0_g1~~TRINITY_DN2547_c0_g1_i1.p1  ORF type:complete len:257 (+),score=42.97 TRINITY_DN2547_c0_g1_i1:69-773(+)
MVKLAVGEKAVPQKEHASWSPYDNNGGTCLAIAGKGYCIAATSTRMSTGYQILTRKINKIFKVNDKCVVLSSGFQGDMATLYKVLQIRNVQYAHEHRRPLSPQAMAQLLSNTFYYKRFFPYYSFSMVAGIDSEGLGAVYNYDVFGTLERVAVYCQGSGSDLVQPILDNQLKAGSPLAVPAQPTVTQLGLEQAVDLVKNVFTSATERDIYTGDGVEIVIITQDGVKTEYMDLKKD